MEELKQYLKNQQEKWLRILNERYQTDGDTPLEDYAKGRLTAYTETLSYINKQEKTDEREERDGSEERGTGEKAQAHGGRSL